jgi:hypothetical protein
VGPLFSRPRRGSCSATSTSGLRSSRSGADELDRAVLAGNPARVGSHHDAAQRGPPRRRFLYHANQLDAGGGYALGRPGGLSSGGTRPLGSFGEELTEHRGELEEVVAAKTRAAPASQTANASGCHGRM